MITRINESNTLTEQISCDCISEFNGKFNSNQNVMNISVNVSVKS